MFDIPDISFLLENKTSRKEDIVKKDFALETASNDLIKIYCATQDLEELEKQVTLILNNEFE